MTHRLEVRVYYEDTDLAGIVYYANYLKFIERGRSEQLRALGIDQTALKERAGVVFAVHRVEAEFRRPARLGDLLCVETTVESVSGARVTFTQDISRAGETIFAARVVAICLSDRGRPVRFPADIRRKYAQSQR